MLQSLTIKNIALISEMTLDLSQGFSVLTGETGAGKSLIIDSIALLLGEKADKSLISYGEHYASVEAVFVSSNEDVLSKLEEFGLEREETIIISRKLSIDGKNECRVNGKSFSLSMLRAITTPLMDLHGQFEHQELLKQSYQLFVLDNFGGKEILKLKSEFKEIYLKLKEIKKKLSSYNFDNKDREKLLDLYAYQINEISEAHFVAGEEEELKDLRVKILGKEKIINSLDLIKNYFDGAGNSFGIVDLLKRCNRELADTLKFMPENSELCNRLSSALIEIEDISDTIDSKKDDLDIDENIARANEERLDLLSSLKKKYGDNIEEINNYLEKIKLEYEKVLNSAEIIEKLEKEQQETTDLLCKKAEELSLARKKFAQIFEEKVVAELVDLSMKNSKFKVEFRAKDENNCDETGFDDIEFLFSANAGQPLKSLSKVASGGEMSRIMLGVKTIIADIDKVDTMIFDEIDTGISGDTANKLAEKLAKIGFSHQVVCVTHLSQVASFGKNHYFISKSTNGEKTTTSLKVLSGSDRVNEIARLIGGTISDFSISHAKLMLDAGKNFLK